MDKKHGEFTGVSDFYFALVITDNEDEYITAAPEYCAPSGEISIAPKESKESVPYDNQVGNTYISEGETDITITISGLSAGKLAEMQGKTYNPMDGRVYDSGQPNPPNYAIGFKYDKGASDYRYYWYLLGKFSSGTEDAKSKGDKIDIKTYQLKFSAVPTTHKFNVEGKIIPQKRVIGETTDPAFDPTGWFTQVQTPDTLGSPDAIELSGIVPADDAIDVAVNASIVATFNNPIKSENIEVIDTDSGTIVTMVKSWNTARTILTMTPSANYANDVLHNIVLAGVTDIYGQVLASIMKDFTTIAA